MLYKVIINAKRLETGANQRIFQENKNYTFKNHFFSFKAPTKVMLIFFLYLGFSSHDIQESKDSRVSFERRGDQF